MVRFVNSNTVVMADVLPEDRSTPIGKLSHSVMEVRKNCDHQLTKFLGSISSGIFCWRSRWKPYYNTTSSIAASNSAHSNSRSNKITCWNNNEQDTIYQTLSALIFEDKTSLEDKHPITVLAAASYINYLVSNQVVLIPKYYKVSTEKHVPFTFLLGRKEWYVPLYRPGSISSIFFGVPWS